MAKITDPDLLAQGVEVEFVTGSKVIKLNTAGDLVNVSGSDGLSFQTLYSFIKEEWKNDSNLIKFAFPMTSITSEQFELINGWNFSGSAVGASGSVVDTGASHYYLRDGGWSVVSPDTGENSEEWMNLTTLGAFDAFTDQAYYYQEAGGQITNTVLTGEVNQGIPIFLSGSNPNIDFNYRSFFKI